VRGCADRNLRKPQQPEDASNRRVTIIVQYLPKTLPVSVSNGAVPTIK
jgi:hypothetical protein